MAHMHIYKAVELLITDCMSFVKTPAQIAKQHLPFAGKKILFGGDFRQVLPVVKLGNRGII